MCLHVFSIVANTLYYSSMYPYECKTGKSLQSETGEVCRTMVSLLQERADACGATIIGYIRQNHRAHSRLTLTCRYELTDLQYAPEIAAGMLVRQQAQALVEARYAGPLTVALRNADLILIDSPLWRAL